MTDSRDERVLLAHGGGGQLTDDFIHSRILPRFGNTALAQLGDSASLDLPSSRICFTTDSYVVKPVFFNGGDIGKLAVCGTVNDLAVSGARPLVLSLALIIETGFSFKLLDKILDSIKLQADESNVRIVTGDTKTVEAGSVDGLFINTAGIGIRLPQVDLGMSKIKNGDKIILSGTIGDHGMTIISQREGIKFDSPLKSDCAALSDLTCRLLEADAQNIKFMRDPTRGGLAVALNDISRATAMTVEIRELSIPVNPVVQSAANMLGFDVLNIANEGKFIAVVSGGSAEKYLSICKNHPLGVQASVIGEIREDIQPPAVEIITGIGGRRIVQMPYGRELPRIC